MASIRSLISGLMSRVSGAAVTVAKAVPGVRAFDIGRSGRRLASIPSAQYAINELIKTYGKRAVARSRYLTQNNPYAASAKETFVSAMVGTGIKPSPIGETPTVKKALLELFSDWVSHADADGVQDYYGLQSVVAGELFEAGEIFAVLEDNEDLLDMDLPPVQVRLLQNEMLPLEDYRYGGVTAGNRVEMGIEFNAQNRRVAYHFLKQMPGTTGQIGNWGTVRVPAEKVIHVFRPIKAGQIRGIPHTLAGMVTLAMLDLYDDAELERKRTAALFAGFITRPADKEEGDSPLGKLTQPSGSTRAADAYTLEPGALIDLEEGESVEFSEPADVGGQYEAFQYRTLLRAAAGFGVPYSSFTGDLRSVNYSSIRAGLVEFRRRVESLQKNVMVFQFCRGVWLAYLNAAVFWKLAPWTAAEYRRNKVKHQRTKHIPPKWDWVDPLKDLQAEKLAVDEGFKAKSDVQQGMGEDPEELDTRIAEDQQRAKDLKLELGDKSKAAAAPGAKPGEPKNEDEEDDASSTETNPNAPKKETPDEK